MKIFRVIIPVSDINRATELYQQLLGQAGQRISSGRHYFDCEGIILALFDPRADGDNFDAEPNPDNIYFSTTELDQLYERAQKMGCNIISEIKVQPWGERSFYLRDMYDNQLCFVDSTTIFTGK